jgi:hypothetical protein
MTTNLHIAVANEAFGDLVGEPLHRVVGKVSNSYRSLDGSTGTDEARVPSSSHSASNSSSSC